MSNIRKEGVELELTGTRWRMTISITENTVSMSVQHVRAAGGFELTLQVNIEEDSWLSREGFG